MKIAFLTMAALSALAVSAPAAAQPRSANHTNSDELQMRIDAGVANGAISQRELAPLRDGLRRLVSLERQFSRNGISGREHGTLQRAGSSLRQQIHFAERDGYRSNDAVYNGERRAEWELRYDREHRAEWEARYLRDRDAVWEGRFAARRSGGQDRFGSDWSSDGRDRTRYHEGFDRPNRGDRFAGDVRVGQRISHRMVNLPVQHRAHFVDDDQVYYRYDDDRIYRVDRRTDMIVAMLDILS